MCTYLLYYYSTYDSTEKKTNTLLCRVSIIVVECYCQLSYLICHSNGCVQFEFNENFAVYENDFELRRRSF